jgi:hypothetical protein
MASRRALLITYHFPPSIAAGAQRWDVFARAGVERGWEFDVIAAMESADVRRDGIRVHGVPEEPHWLNRLTNRLVVAKNQRRRVGTTPQQVTPQVSVEPQVIKRSDIRFPRTLRDVRRNVRALMAHTNELPWMNGAGRLARQLVAEHRYDVIIASGPPHVSCEAARVAAVASGTPLVLDFRDPWSLIDVIQERFASWSYFTISARLERRVVGASSLLVMNTPRAARAMQAVYPSADIISVPNGFNGQRPSPRHPNDRFIAMYAGTIYLDRDPRPLLAAVARLAPELGLTPDNFCLQFVGRELSFGGRSPEQLAADAGVPPGLVESRGAVPRTQLFEAMEAVAMLVNLPQGEVQCVPSKVYEYLHFPAWVLGIEHQNTATHDVLSAVGADIAAPGDVSAIAERLRARVLEFRSGGRPAPLVGPDEFFAPREAQRFFEAVEQRLVAAPLGQA